MINLPIILFPNPLLQPKLRLLVLPCYQRHHAPLMCHRLLTTNSLLQAAIFDFGQNLEISLPYAAFKTERTVFGEKAMEGKGQQN